MTQASKMALRPALLASTHKPFHYPTLKHRILKTQATSPHFITSLPTKQHCTSWVGLRCASASAANFKDHLNQYRANKAAVPRPAKIPLQRRLYNSVRLIGIVGAPVEIKHLPSGKVLAWTRLVVSKSPTGTFRISLTFWDDMAQIAFQHVQEGSQIFVFGQLVANNAESNNGKMQTDYKVVVQQLNFIEGSSPVAAPFDCDSNTMLARRNVGNGAGSDMGSVEELWQAFFANPLEWWDNRANKRNPRAPDFKHKDTGEALWIEGRYNPSWVKSQLARLDEKMGSFQSQDARWPLS